MVLWYFSALNYLSKNMDASGAVVSLYHIIEVRIQIHKHQIVKMIIYSNSISKPNLPPFSLEYYFIRLMFVLLAHTFIKIPRAKCTIFYQNNSPLAIPVENGGLVLTLIFNDL